MAIYKGREVQVIGEASKGVVTSDTVSIMTKEGSYETVKVGELQFTEQEKKDLQKGQTDKFGNVSVISDKDLNDIRDSQDEEKVKAKLEKEQAPQNVTIKAQGAQVDKI